MNCHQWRMPVLLVSGLLQACSTVAPRQALVVTPLLRIEDARALPARTAPVSLAAAPQQQPEASAAAATTLPVVQSRMEIVRLGPNEYRLQYRQPAAVSPAVAGPAPSAAAPLQIVNGNGVRGMGERVRALLAHQGIAARQVVNQRGHYQRTTIIEYLPGQQRRAADLRAALSGHAVLLPARALPDGLALRLVLGRDHVARLTALAAPAVRLAATAPLLSALDAPALPSFNQE